MKKYVVLTIVSSLFTISSMAFTQDFVLKGRGGIVRINDSVKTGNKDTKSSHKTKDGWLGEVAVDYLLTRNIAFEASVGYGMFKLRNNQEKQRNTTITPVTGTVMFRLPMYEQFYPYIGAGYSYSILSGAPAGTKINNTHGLVLQTGADFFFEKTNVSNPIGINLDIKYYIKSKANITETSSTGTQETFSNKLSVLTILGGVTVPF